MKRLPLESLLASSAGAGVLVELLEKGGVAAVPTETFYGLAASPWSETGVERIFAAKGRDDGKPLPVLVGAASDLPRLGIDVPEAALARWVALWPAALTVVLPVTRPIAASRGGGTLAVRIPALPSLRRLLAATGPVTGTSANRSGDEPLSDPDRVASSLGNSIDLLIDGGVTPGGLPSTIVDATREAPILVRAGAFAWPPREGQVC
jgi:L-threonylcarbamoyladenylate synthase